MNSKFKQWLPLALLVLCALTMAAAVNGIFNNVNAILGYQVNGAAGSTGQALCSDGTRYDTPCSVASGGVTSAIAGTGINVSSATGAVTFSLANAGAGAATYTCPVSVTINAQGQTTTVTGSTCPTAPTPLTSGTNGYYEILSNGTIVDHVNLTSLPNDNTYHAYTLPHSFASFVASFTCSVDRPGGNPGPLGVQSGGLSDINLLSNTGGSGTLMNASCTVTGL